ncbi:F-box domain [Arabidopsis suecica]|uniref:F-box domain n=1 Tax=Arabidopsis suecica TaxID=45249 RepID=A0A8T2HDX8_ARASU|nr:F-box domain [Arabidopsis suecica]
MNRGETLDSIPTDLILDILSRLPTKSIARFHCVSKLWSSMLASQDFTRLFVNRSSSNPRLLLGIVRGGEWSFYSSPQPKNPYEKSSLEVAADFHMKLSEIKQHQHHGTSYAFGLIYLRTVWMSKEGFDPIGKQFKVLVLNILDNHYILTLGTENDKWRSIQSSLRYRPCGQSPICINGVLYYIAYDTQDSSNDVIGCFDVRFEKFKFFHVNHDMRISRKRNGTPDNNVVKVNYNLSFVGVTTRGEIVLAKMYACKPFYVFYYNPENNTLLSVEIQGVGEDSEWFSNYQRVYVFVDHVKDLHQFDNMKTSINLPEQKRKPTSISISSKYDDHVRTTLISSRKNQQVTTVSRPQQDRRTTNKFSALCLLDDEEFSGV